MLKYFILIVSCLLSVIVEGSITTFPLSILVIILSYIILRSNLVFVLAFLMGLLLDVMTFRRFGITSMIFLGLLFLIFLYQRKFEIASLPFVFFSLLIGGYTYAKFVIPDNQFLQSLLIAILGSLIYLCLSAIHKKEKTVGL